jgi:malate synthase
MDYKEYARQLRENAAKDENGVIRCSPELWEQIASIIEELSKRNDELNVLNKFASQEAIKEFTERLKEQAYPFKFSLISEIDDLVKEMVGE